MPDEAAPRLPPNVCQWLLRLLQGGFNRWTHKEKFGPLRMTPAEGEGSHCSATVSVPSTAHSVDFVLSDVLEGEGTYDNRGGLDYHLPVEGSEVRKHDFCLIPQFIG